MKLMNWIRWNTLCLMPMPDFKDYPSSYSEYSEIDRGYEAWCADSNAVDAFNNRPLAVRWADRINTRRERRAWLKRMAEEDRAREMAGGDEYDPFADDDDLFDQVAKKWQQEEQKAQEEGVVFCHHCGNGKPCDCGIENA